MAVCLPALIAGTATRHSCNAGHHQQPFLAPCMWLTAHWMRWKSAWLHAACRSGSAGQRSPVTPQADQALALDMGAYITGALQHCWSSSFWLHSCVHAKHVSRHL